MGWLDVALGRAQSRMFLGAMGLPGDVIVLQSPWMEPLARSFPRSWKIYGAIDEDIRADSRPACDWASAIFCASQHVESIIARRHPGKPIWNLGQCGRFTDDYEGPRDPVPTIVYIGLDHEYMLSELMRSCAKLPARIILIGCDTNTAKRIFGNTIPGNVEPLGWLAGKEFGRAVARGWVGIVPYDPEHQRVIQSNPDKICDYLLGGLMVVSTPIPEFRARAGVVVANADRFRQSVGDSLDRYSPALASRQREIGLLGSSEAYVERFLRALENWMSGQELQAGTPLNGPHISEVQDVSGEVPGRTIGRSSETIGDDKNIS